MTSRIARVATVVAMCVVVTAGFEAPAGGVQNRLTSLIVASVLVVFLPLGILLMAGVVLLRSLGNPGLLGAVTVADALILAVIARVIFGLIGAMTVRIPPASQWLLALLLWLWFTTLLSPASLTPLMRITVYALLSVALASGGRPRNVPLYGGFVAYCVIELVISMPSQASDRLIGITVGDPQELSILLFAGLAPLLARRLDFPARNVVVGLLVAGVLLSRTRGAWGAFLVLFLVSQMSRVTRRKLAFIIGGIFASALLLYGPVTEAFELNPRSRSIREQSVERGIRAGLSSPLVGRGWSADLEGSGGNVDYDGYVSRTQPFNVFVSVFAFAGLPGLGLLIGFVGTLLRSALTGDRAVLLFLSAFLTLSLTEMTIYAGALGTVTFFVFAGLGQRTEPTGSTHAPHRRASPRAVPRASMGARARKAPAPT